jgi:hypothetical protein
LDMNACHGRSRAGHGCALEALLSAQYGVYFFCNILAAGDLQ